MHRFFAAGVRCADFSGVHITLMPPLLLLVFHLGLIEIVLLLAAGRLTYLRGGIEISEGAQFDAKMTASEVGPWHQSGLNQGHFSNDGLRIAYELGVQRDNTRNAS